MKFINRIYISGTEDLVYYENNRCFTNDEKICNDLGFSQKDVAIFNRRVKKIGKSISIFGYLECCEIKVFKLNNKLFIGDGQGRLAKLNEINKDKNDDEKIIVPCLIYEVENEEEMSEAIRGMNMCNTNWSQTDNIRCQIRTSNDEELINILNKINEIIAFLGINNSNASDMLMGQGSRKMDCDWKKKQMWSDIDDFVSWIRSIYDACENEGWTQQEITKLKSQKFLEVIKEHIYKRTKKYSPLMLDEMKKYVRMHICGTEKDMRNHFSNDREYLRQLLTDYLRRTRRKDIKTLYAILKDKNNK